MKKFTDADIKTWIVNNERFDARSFGHGLYMRFRKNDTSPVGARLKLTICAH